MMTLIAWAFWGFIALWVAWTAFWVVAIVIAATFEGIDRWWRKLRGNENP